MAELSVQERLQPTLLDRLTDDAPTNRQESRDSRVFSVSGLREGVLRDLSWLLNTCHLAATEDLAAYPEVGSSVLNYGIPSLTGNALATVDATRLQRAVEEAIGRFEPRLIRRSLKVILRRSASSAGTSALNFEIEAELWAQPVPLRLFLKTELDLELGTVKAIQQVNPGR